MNDDAVVHHLNQPESNCTLCRRIFSPENDINGFETLGLCGDCKLLFLEDHEATVRESHLRRPSRGRRATRYSSSESIEDLFSHQFSNLLNLVRQDQYASPLSVSEHEEQLVDGDLTARALQRSSSRTTPSGSRRWRRALSDNESEGFDNWDSAFGETESNLSLGGYWAFHGESDAVSFSVYGGESDASIDGRSFQDGEMFIQQDDGSNVGSDTDIDPMHAGLSQWNSDDQDEEEDGEWEEANIEEPGVGITEAEESAQVPFARNSGENHRPLDWLRHLESPENRATVHWRVRQSWSTYAQNIFANLDETETNFMGNSGDYLDTRGLEQLLEQLAETDRSRRGAPPAAASFVDSLPCIVITKEHENDNLVCAICKETLLVGTKVKQLPCMHLYHPPCILPWLNARNSCPLCRYELPTDDKDYEEGKQNARSRIEVQEIQQDDASEDGSSSSSSDDDDISVFEGNGVCESPSIIGRIAPGDVVVADSATGRSGRDQGRGSSRWFFLAAAPVVSLVGIVLVFWFRSPLVGGGRGPRGYCGFPQQQEGLQFRPSPPGSAIDQRPQNRNRRWWSLF